MKKLINPLLFIALAVILRLVPHMPNVAPIAAMALFGGVYLNKKYALIVPLVAMFLSDIFLGFHNVMPFVYGSFLVSGLLGLLVRNHKSFINITGVTLLSSVIFFTVTNFGVWVMGNMYPHTLSGLMTCYAMGVPFFRNTLVGDLFYAGVLFGSYELVLHLVKGQAIAKVSK